MILEINEEKYTGKKLTRGVSKKYLKIANEVSRLDETDSQESFDKQLDLMEGFLSYFYGVDIEKLEEELLDTEILTEFMFIGQEYDRINTEKMEELKKKGVFPQK